MKIEQEYKLQNYYLAYFDVLGYKAFFNEEESDHQKFLKDILGTLDYVKSQVNEFSSFSSRIGLRVYSDNFLLYIKEEGQDKVIEDFNALAALTSVVALIQVKILAQYRILLRGGITKGEFYVDENIIFGKGLIQAVEIESNKAIYPRVVIDVDNFSLMNYDSLWKYLIKKDDDGIYFVDYFNINIYQNVYFDHEKTIGLIQTLRGKIILLIKKYCNYDNLSGQDEINQRSKLIEKYLWVLNKFNDFCNDSDGTILMNNFVEEKRFQQYAIEYSLSLNKKLLKMEVKCKEKLNEKQRN